MALGYKIYEPSGKTTIVVSEDRDNAKQRIDGM